MAKSWEVLKWLNTPFKILILKRCLWIRLWLFVKKLTLKWLASLPVRAHWTKTVIEKTTKLDVKMLPAKFKRLASFFTLSILCCTQFQTCASAAVSQFSPNFRLRARYPGFVNRCAALALTLIDVQDAMGHCSSRSRNCERLLRCRWCRGMRPLYWTQQRRTSKSVEKS